ncbi:MAG TPA: hypothetical protein VF147_12205, partial [Vicinamibacterales bacterium]
MVSRILLLLVASLALVRPISSPSVSVLHVRGSGLQPQAVVDSAGVLHVLYFTGAPSGGDLQYVQRRP